jgi:sugar lactone lactonase YvrE
MSQQLSGMDDKERRESDEEAGAGRAAFANVLGVALVLVGAAALAIAMFLPFAQPFGAIPIVGNDNLYGKLGWYGIFFPFLLALAGYKAGQGKQSGRWSLVVGCAVAAIGIVLLANAKSLRTLYPVGAGGAVDTTQPGLVTNLGIAIYVAGAAVAVAFVGTLALFQSAGREVTQVESRLQRNTRVRDTRVAPGSEGDPRPEHAALEVEASGAEVETQAVEAPTHAIRSRLQSAWPLIAAIVVVVATAAGYLLFGRPSTPSNTAQQPTKLTPEQVALGRLLLSAEQINTAVGTSGLTVGGTAGAMVDFASKISDEACLPIVSPAGTDVYQGSGWTTVVGQEIREPGNFFRHGVDQFVVSFPSAKEAGAFFTSSTQSWQACANRDYTVTTMGQNLVHTVGPVSNADGALTVSHTQKHLNGTYACQRALTVANNIVIDVAACSLNMSDAPSDSPSGAASDVPSDPPSGAAVNIAHQIAAKVPNTQHRESADGPQVTLPLTGLINPSGVAVDSAGNLYVADTVNHRVLKLAAGSSTQTVLPLTGLINPSGVAVDSAGNLYVADWPNNRVVKLAAGSSTQTVLPFTGLNAPEGVAVDAAGNLYVTDSRNNRGLELAAGSSSQTVLPFTGLGDPGGAAVDAAGNLYVTDHHNDRVLKLAPGSGTQTVLPFTGLNGPIDVAVDTAGNLYVADNGNSRVVKLAAGSATQTVLPLTGVNGPVGVAVDAAGNLYVTDNANNRVVKLAVG